MTTESAIELQKIDCNCNDCVFMIRDINKYKESVDKHHKWQFDYFTICKNKLIARANYHKDRYYDLETWDLLLTEAENMKFQFNKNEAMINFGKCDKFNSNITFIPNTIQLHTQQCFKHRRENK